MKNVFLMFSFVVVLLISACGGKSSSPDTPLATDPTVTGPAVSAPTPTTPVASATTPTAPTATVPAAPAGATITPGDGKATLSWTAVADATSYNAYYGTTAGVTIANGTKVAGATSGSAITGLVNGTPYFFVVTAVNTAGESAVSNEVTATPHAVVVAPVVGVPVGVAVGAGDTKLPLSWRNVPGATSYNVYYGTAAGVTKANGTKITGTLSESPVTGLTNETKYYLVVTSVTAGVESAASSEVSATPHASSPGMTSGITIVSGLGQVTLKWTAVTGATSYNVYYGTTAGVTTASATKVIGAASGMAISGLTNGTKYFFIITAKDAQTEYPASTEVSAMTLASIPNLMGGAIQKPLTLTGTVTTYAGTAGVKGSTDGIGTASLFDSPSDATTDGTIMYVTEAGTGKIRKVVFATGEVKTLVNSSTGNPVANNSFSSYGTQPSYKAITTDCNNLYIEWDFDRIVDKIDITTGAVAGFVGDYGINNMNIQGFTTDGTNLYVTSPYAIFKVVIATGVKTTLAGIPGSPGNVDGGPVARFNSLNGITTDGTYLYVVDAGNKLIRKVEIATGVVSTIAGGGSLLTYDGTGTAAKFVSPSKITMDGTNLYVTDTGTHTIRKVVIASGVVTTIAGTELLTGSTDGVGRSARFNAPAGITTDGTSLYVSDSGNNTIRKIQ